MFIRKTLTRRAGVDYSSYRFVRDERVDGRVKQITLINLGADFELPLALWPNFCARIAELLSPPANGYSNQTICSAIANYKFALTN
jgi:hypothetical protein